MGWHDLRMSPAMHDIFQQLDPEPSGVILCQQYTVQMFYLEVMQIQTMRFLSLHFCHYIDKHVLSTCYIPGVVLDVGSMKKIQFLFLFFFSKSFQSRQWSVVRGCFQSHL